MMKKRVFIRLSNLEYFIFFIGITLFYGIYAVVISRISMNNLMGITSLPISLVIILVGYFIAIFIATICRLRDRDMSYFWLLLLIIPYINIIFVIVLFFLKGTEGVNKYGPTRKELLRNIRELMAKGYTRGQAKNKIFRELDVNSTNPNNGPLILQQSDKRDF